VGYIQARRMLAALVFTATKPFFGIVHKGRLFFKIDDSTVGLQAQDETVPAQRRRRSRVTAKAEIIEDADSAGVGGAAVSCQEGNRKRRFKAWRFLRRHAEELLFRVEEVVEDQPQTSGVVKEQ
jgi:hypothetical protein